MCGLIGNKRVEISKKESLQFLKTGQVAYVASVGEDGFPYVTPFVYVYEGGDKLYLHIDNIRESHFWTNIKINSQISIKVSEMGALHPGKKAACQSSLVYTSVVLLGMGKHITDDTKKAWFFDRLLEKYSDPIWRFEKESYPVLHKIELFEIQIEQVTGKHNKGLVH